jgi:hypothetical protein
LPHLDGFANDEQGHHIPCLEHREQGIKLAWSGEQQMDVSDHYQFCEECEVLPQALLFLIVGLTLLPIGVTPLFEEGFEQPDFSRLRAL